MTEKKSPADGGNHCGDHTSKNSYQRQNSTLRGFWQGRICTIAIFFNPLSWANLGFLVAIFMYEVVQ